MNTATKYEHIAVDSDQVAVISGTGTKVVELVLDYIAYGWSPEELHFQHPHLSLGKIHSALAYYWDHRDELDQEVTRRLVRVKQLLGDVKTAHLLHRLRQKP